MDDFGIYAVFGTNSPPQRLLRYVQLLYLFVVNSRLVSSEIKVNICINDDLITSSERTVRDRLVLTDLSAAVTF